MKKLFSLLMSLNLIISPVAFAQGSGDQFRAGSSGKNGGADFYANQILSLGTGIIGATILTKCKLGAAQPSIMIFMGGGLAYIAKEILGGKGQGNFHKAKVADLKMVEAKMKEIAEGGEVQKEVLETALADEKNNLKMIKGRKTWMLAITTIFTAAAVMAIVEKILSLPPPAGIKKPGEAACTPNPNSSGLLTKGLVMAYGAASGMAGGGTISQVGGMAVGLAGHKLFEKLTFLTVNVQDKATGVYSKPIGRAIAFGASAALSGVVTAGLGKRQKIAEENIGKLEKVVAEFKKNTDATGGLSEGQAGGEGNLGSTSNLANAIPAHCFSNEGGSLDYSEAGCKNPVKVNTAEINLNNSTLSSVSNLSTKLANSVSNGNMADAELAVSELASMSSRVNDEKERMQKLLNEKLKAANEETVDLDKDIASQVASMQNDINNAAATEGANLASGDKAEIAPQSPTNTTTNITSVAAPEMQMPDMNMDLSGSTAVEDYTGPAETASLDDSLNQYESTEQDISKKSEVSIFKQVSNRYLLNYTKIFKEKKRIEDLAP